MWEEWKSNWNNTHIDFCVLYVLGPAWPMVSPPHAAGSLFMPLHSPHQMAFLFATVIWIIYTDNTWVIFSSSAYPSQLFKLQLQKTYRSAFQQKVPTDRFRGNGLYWSNRRKWNNPFNALFSCHASLYRSSQATQPFCYRKVLWWVKLCWSNTNFP